MNTFKWCGCTWTNEMEGGRIVHLKQPWQWYSNSESVIVRMRNGEIHLYSKENPRKIHYEGNIFTADYEVATMRCKESFDFGTFSCEIKVPKGKNLSASFWLTGEGNWPPEIDIMEGFLKECWFSTTESRFPWINPGWKTTNNVVYRDRTLEQTHIGSKNVSILKQPKDPSENFIKYECEWLPDKITFKANGKVTRIITGHVCKDLIENIKDPEKGYKMNVVFNVWVENPLKHDIEQYTPMVIRNFKHEPLCN